MANKFTRYPYQPSLPQPKVVSPPVSMGYPAPAYTPGTKNQKIATQRIFDKNVEEIKAQEILKEAGVEPTAKEFLKLLEDEKRLAEVVKKLKLKAFW